MIAIYEKADELQTKYICNEKIESESEFSDYVLNLLWDLRIIYKKNISEYKDGSGMKVDFYDKSPSDPNHKSIHTHINNDGTYSTQDNVNGSTEKSSGGCYLTWACMKHFQEKFDDNCHELTVLRWFRDNFVSKEDIEHYYEVAPIIVEKINKEEKTGIVYDYIYDNVVDYCVEQIEQGNYDKAYNRYKNSVLILEEQFAKPEVTNRFVKNLKLKNNN